MTTAASSGRSQFPQVYNRLVGPSSQVPSGTVGNTVQNHSLTKLGVYEFGHVLNFLEPQGLARSERVCKTFTHIIHLTDQWKIQCQIQLGLSAETDLKEYLPEGPSYKESLQLIFANVLDARVYELYIGKVGSVRPIPEGISLKKWNESDPCDSTKKIGAAYVWMYCPSHIEIDLKGFSLDKVDDPNDSEAPKLIRREEGEEQSENTVLKVPVTINNIETLFQCPKTGNSSKYYYIWNEIGKQHGNKRIQAGWICMRRDVIGRGLLFEKQQELATEKGVVLSELLPRILFNFLEHARSKKVNVYPDGEAPLTYARTSTLTSYSEGNACSGCGDGGPSGLIVTDSLIDGDSVGVSVALPAEV